MGALLDAVPAGGADHTEHHRDLATAIEAGGGGAVAASDVSFTPTGTIAATNVQAAIAEVASEAGGGTLTPGVDYPTSATVTLSSAQLLDLHNTPVTLVAAPGAGKYIAVHKVVAYLNHVTTDYVSSSGDLSVCYSGEEADPYSTVNLQRSADHIAVEAVQQMSLPAASMVNVAIVAAANGSVFTLGDGTLPITVWYTIEDVPA